MLSFSEALDQLKDGYSVLRYSDVLDDKEIIMVHTDKLRGLFKVNYLDQMTPFFPSFDDLVAEDWYVVCKTFSVT
jgi:hypothetical protein